ncbi:PREDICTED: B3 domain-containing protein Os01g0234100-like [Ipomoea nil]|uniref:B3 domain-containing protein Os01g0234100-like n=1 Tax=Ipomoea nil TaxID=35883 RepID=UPI0009011BEE|nr:PREDICTED: B3 domain-containing protein Os01g0234100-like [Ipomoea nil]
MKALTDNKKVVNRGSPPLKKSKMLVKARSEVVKKEYMCVDENSLAMRRAQELQANLSPEFPSLVKFMLHSHTTGGFWLGLPKKFCASHLPNHNAAIVLVDENGEEMETRYLVQKCGLSAGWRGFSLAHNLIAGDVVVFQLIEPFKMKVYIVRENGLTDVAGAISLLNLSHSAQPIASEGLLQQNEDTKENVMRICDPADQGDDQQGEISTSDHFLESNLSGNDIDNNSPRTSSNGLRFAEAVVDFAQVEDFEGFNIVVNNIVIDSEIPEAHRLKYYELCCSRKAYLHESLLDGLNYKLIAGAITETVNIADAIRAARLTTGCELLEVWDATLRGIEQFGIQVGFLRDRISKLVRLSGDVVASKKKEKAVAEAEMTDLRGKMWRVREVIDNLDTEIQAYSSKERVEELFKDAANAAW